MELAYRKGPDDRMQIIITMTEKEDELLQEDVGLPALLQRSMEAIIAIRSGQRPAGVSTEAANWADMIRRTSQLIRNLEGVRDGALRAFDRAKGSHGQLAKALGIPRSTAQTQREALLAKAPSAWEPVPAEIARKGEAA